MMSETISTAKIYSIPAECFSGCSDPWCPYIHIETWHRVGDKRSYGSYEEALAADNVAEDQETIRTGDWLTNELIGE